jgi:very-short-patch-repair endonuclease
MTSTPTLNRTSLAELLRKRHGVVASILTACAAGRRHGLKAPRIDAVDVLGPAARRRRSAGFAEVAEGIRSGAEADLRDLVKRAGLPVPMFNARLYRGRVLVAVADAWWPDARVAAEVDSREWHLSPEDWERTLRRHARMSAQGILALHFTPRQIRTEPAQVIATIRAALDAGRASRQLGAGPAADGVIQPSGHPPTARRRTAGHISGRPHVNQVNEHAERGTIGAKRR